jgi:gliding motility-associated-like protein
MKNWFLGIVLAVLGTPAFSQYIYKAPSNPPLGSSGTTVSTTVVQDPNNPQNGNNSLGQTYDLIKCGLNYTQASVKLGQRYGLSCCPNTVGAVQPAAFVISGIPTCAVIEKAYLWAGLSGNGIVINASITNPASTNQVFPMTIIGTDQDKCWGFNATYTYRADVTSIIAGNGNYMISGLPTSTTQSGNDTDGATLFIIYSIPTATYQGEIHIWDGCYVGIGNNYSTNITGFTACGNSTVGSAWIISADHQQINSTFIVNGGAPFQIGLQEDWYNYIGQNTAVTTGQNTSNFQIQTSGDCYNWMVMGLYFQTTTCTTCVPMTSNMSLTSQGQDATCNVCNGTATVTPNGGVPPYTYSWNTVPVQTTQTATGLCAGQYIVTVSDATGCATDMDTIQINTIGGVGVTSTSAPVLCFGGNTGSATATSSGGAPPFTFSWSTTPVQTNATATGLSAGTYTVTITDSQGCTDTSIIIITQPTQVTAVTNLISDALCFGSADGSASVTPGGGTGSYSYAWSSIPMQTTSTATGLAAGTYSVIVADANNCTATALVTINEPTAVTTQIVFDPANCGLQDGQSTVNASGGTGPYTYSWSTTPPQTGATASGLSAGNYTVTVTDANGCSSTIAVAVIDTANPVALFTANPMVVWTSNPTVFFTDFSVNANTWFWTFGDPNDSTTSTQLNPFHTYSDTGTYCIWLFISNTVCTDSMELCIRVEPETQIYVPSAFTPNGDGKNDYFFPEGVYIEDFKMYIYDRWGNNIFYTDQMVPGWDGKANNGSKVAQEDVYVWLIRYKDTHGLSKQLVGHVSLVK